MSDWILAARTWLCNHGIHKWYYHNIWMHDRTCVRCERHEIRHHEEWEWHCYDKFESK